ncbi:GNAT family N-acetyltransferase [Halomonas binhaiensis]|nr:GNAT family N-acetyltransferase [Halomonas binhaiensis]
MNPRIVPACTRDYDFAFSVKKDALGPHIERQWGWDEEYQLRIHEQRWREKPWFLIYLGEQKVGTVSLQEAPSTLRFGEFYISSKWRGKGIGTRVITDVVSRCDIENRTCKLEYLKWNPVGSLYKRHGFEVVDENDIHYFMLRCPSSTP